MSRIPEGMKRKEISKSITFRLLYLDKIRTTVRDIISWLEITLGYSIMPHIVRRNIIGSFFQVSLPSWNYYSLHSKQIQLIAGAERRKKREEKTVKLSQN